MNTLSRFLLLSMLLGISIIANVHSVSAYTPQPKDSFNYTETITVNNGQGIYSGYTDQTSLTGMEQVSSVSGSTISTHYSWSSSFSSNQGSSSTNSSSGDYTWSSSNFTYISGTDSQYGYSKPTYVWFAMNPSLPVGGTFEVLNTPFTVLSKSYSFQVPGGTRYILTIQTQGTGQFQRNDVYGQFTASYTWTAYYDPATGYIVGYNYVEQDTGCWTDPSNPSLGCQSASFTWTDNLGVTSTSYALTPGTAPFPYVEFAAVIVVILLVVGLALYIRHRRRRMDTIPEHPPTPGFPPGPPPSEPWQSRIDLGSKPQEQVVLRDVAMKNCKYCGILIPTTAEKCPYCGGANQ